MAFSAGSITATLGLDTDPFARGMIRAESIMRIFPASVSSFLTSPLLGVVNLLKAVASGVIDAFTCSAAAADRLGDMATNIGVSVEALSGLGLVAKQAGASVETVADAFKFLGRNAADAAAGEKQANEMFRDVGISAIDTYGQIKPLDQLMMELADGLAALPNPADRTRVAMGLMGRSGTEMVATLTQGSAVIDEQIERYKRWGAVVTQESVRTADRWQDSMQDISFAWEGLKNRLGERLRISLLPHLEELLRWIDDNQGKIDGWIASIVEGMKDAAASVRELVKEWQTFKSGPVPPVVAALGAGAAGMALARGLGIGGAGVGTGAAARFAGVGMRGPLVLSAAGAAAELASGGSTNDAIRQAIATGGTFLLSRAAGLATGPAGALAFGAFNIMHESRRIFRETQRAMAFNRELAEFRKSQTFRPPEISTGLALPFHVMRADEEMERAFRSLTVGGPAPSRAFAPLQMTVDLFKSIFDTGRDIPSMFRQIQDATRELMQAFTELAAEAIARRDGAPTTQPTTQPAQVRDINVKIDRLDESRLSTEIGRSWTR